MVFTRKSKPEVELHKLLPRCDGPKLHYFGQPGERFTLVDILSSESSGAHGHVFEVLLGTQPYVLKVASNDSAQSDILWVRCS